MKAHSKKQRGRKRLTASERLPAKKLDAPVKELDALAQEMERQLNVIQRRMRQRLQAEYARGQLTGPQRLVMATLIRHQGLSLKRLSEQVSLAHSTVSGIVDRLVKQGLAERKTLATDGRVTLLVASWAVRNFLEKEAPALSLHPLLAALKLASEGQRKAIKKGLNTLARLLASEGGVEVQTDGDWLEP